MMMPTAGFRETQRFSQWWLYVLIALPFLGVLFTTALSMHDTRTHHAGVTEILSAFLISASVLAWFLFMRLATVINENGIDVRFRGLPFGRQSIGWDEIRSADVVSYRPLRDYGGWGIRYGLSKGWCYNVRGKTGLKLTLKSGRQLMIGTQQPEALKETLTHYFHS